MFERFTERARQVVVLAQEEAVALGHGWIGTEHILLGLMREEEGLAARALKNLGLKIEAVREIVAKEKHPAEVYPGEKIDTEKDWSAPEGPTQIPFTTMGKWVLERSLREALSLGHNYIGTEHILLGAVDGGMVEEERRPAASDILLTLGINPERVRVEVLNQHRRDPRGRAHPSGTYKVAIVCENCGLGGGLLGNYHRIDIGKGTRVESHPCPDCGCRTLKRHPGAGK